MDCLQSATERKTRRAIPRKPHKDSLGVQLIIAIYVTLFYGHTPI